MKASSPILVALTFLWAATALAEDAYFYGAWWHTKIDRLDALTKQAGRLEIVFHDGGTFTMRREHGVTNALIWRGRWERMKDGRNSFWTTNTADGFRGVGNVNTVTGKFKLRSASGSFQATRQPLPLN